MSTPTPEPIPDRPLDPEHCQSMSDVRAGVDAVDAELLGLLARRFGYMRAAARIKPHRGSVRDEARKAQVIANAVAHAEGLGVPAGLTAELWERLVEGSIAYEFDAWDDRRSRES
jgi:isochorismate pyruvate lyase